MASLYCSNPSAASAISFLSRARAKRKSSPRPLWPSGPSPDSRSPSLEPASILQDLVRLTDSGLPDDETHIVHRGEHTFVITFAAPGVGAYVFTFG